MNLDNQNSSSQTTETPSETTETLSQTTETPSETTETSSQVTETSTEVNGPELHTTETSSEIKKAVALHLLLFLPYFLFHVFILGTGFSLQGINSRYKAGNVILLINIVLLVIAILIRIKYCRTTHWKAKERWRTFHHVVVALLIYCIFLLRFTEL